MVKSGRLLADPVVEDLIICGTFTEGSLPPHQISEITKQYKESVSEYAAILTEYENSAERATNYREKSVFPNKEVWNPPGRTLNSFERELLVGPSMNVAYFKKLTVRDKITNRLIEYSCINTPIVLSNVPKQSSSFVSFHSPNQTNPQFGCVISLFRHTFAQSNYFWAIVQQFAAPAYDSELNMPYVSLQNVHVAQSVILPLDKVSYPLVVAFDDDQLWFLNY